MIIPMVKNNTGTVPFNVRTGYIASDISFHMFSLPESDTQLYLYIASDCLTPGKLH